MSTRGLWIISVVAALAFICSLPTIAEDGPDTTTAPKPDAVPQLELDTTLQELRADVTFLADDLLRGRDAGSVEDAITQLYIATRFEEAGLRPAGDAQGEAPSYRQQFSFDHWGKTVETANVIGKIQGKDEAVANEILVIGAHHDHVGSRPDGTIYNGADDNASGIAGLIAIGRRIARLEKGPRRTVLLVAFGAEEKGLRGAQHFLEVWPEEGPKIIAMWNLDMISRARFLDREELGIPKRIVGIRDQGAAGILGSPAWFVLHTRRVCKTRKIQTYEAGDFPALKLHIERIAKGRNDAAPFERAGIPALLISTSENDDYHKPTDTLDKVDFTVLRSLAGAILQAVVSFDARFEKGTLGEARD